MTGASALERVLRRDRAIVAAGLAVLVALAWAWLLAGAGMGASAWEMTRLSLFPHTLAQGGDHMAMDMGGMDMGGMDMAPATAWSLRMWVLAIAMWQTMMVAMMAPSAAPMILLYGRVRRHAAGQGREGPAIGSTAVFTAGYLLVWLAFSVAAAGLQAGLEANALTSAALMGSASKWLSAGVLLAAGLYQLSPAKNLCLAQCRAPAVFLSRHWRPGAGGALRLGILHGAYCVGCCWMLMALLFVGGVMNLAWIAALALLVMAEKLLAAGPWVARASGAALILWAAATALV